MPFLLPNLACRRPTPPWRILSRLGARPAAKFLAGLLLVLGMASEAHAWWNPEWTVRKKLTVDTTGAGALIGEPIGGTTVLIRLHDGNFQFTAGKEDGSDLRFVAADEKTLLSHHVERFDALLNEAFVWVKLPEVAPGAQTVFWLYYGNLGEKAVRTDDPKGSYDPATVLVYHFGEKSGAPADSSAGGNSASNPGVAVSGSMIGGGLRLNGSDAITIPASDSLAWNEGAALTFSAWIKPATLAANALLFSRSEGGNALRIGLDNGAPFVEVNNGSGAGSPQRSAPGGTAGTPVAINVWRHLAVVAEGAKITVFLDGENYATLNAALPALKTPAFLGKDAAPDADPQAGGFAGEIDQVEIAKAARPAGALKLAAISQSGSDRAGKLLAGAADELSGGGGGHSAMLEHVMLFGDIAKNMMFDGWIAVGVCVIMIIFGWAVAIKKFTYLNSIQKGSDAFMRQWKHVSSDLTALDHDDAESVKTLGGGALDKKTLRDMHRSPLYHLYHIGSEEISHRVGRGKDRSQGLSARSIQAIRASLETGLVRENQRMHKGLIFLTISIAGGPYVGLLGTVVGVMITFAIIAKSGEVEVNSIAPGIASALLATVAGLVVAIPALFIYSYLSSRIKDLLAAMQVFIDEFIAKMAEFYPTPADLPPAQARGPLSQEARTNFVEPTGSNHHAS